MYVEKHEIFHVKGINDIVGGVAERYQRFWSRAD